MTDGALQPDQSIEAWSSFVADYEAIFELLTDRFARTVFDRLDWQSGVRFLDVGCGPGGAALVAAAKGAEVIAIDASTPMVDRARARALMAELPRFRTRTMDARRLDLPDESVDIAYSGFGVVLLPDPTIALEEMARVLVPGGTVAILTWTEPENYELATRLREAIEAVLGTSPPSPGLPAQLRYARREALAELLAAAGFAESLVDRLDDRLVAPSAAALRAQIAFAPGMAATLDAMGENRARVLDCFQTRLEAEFGAGPVSLRAVAHAAVARKGSHAGRVAPTG